MDKNGNHTQSQLTLLLVKARTIGEINHSHVMQVSWPGNMAKKYKDYLYLLKVFRFTVKTFCYNGMVGLVIVGSSSFYTHFQVMSRPLPLSCPRDPAGAQPDSIPVPLGRLPCEHAARAGQAVREQVGHRTGSARLLPHCVQEA